MTKLSLVCLLAIGGSCLAQTPAVPRTTPPAVPLVTHDPYLSIWSMTDHLNDNYPKHWTGATHGMSGLIRIDGKAYRFLGGWQDAPPLPQKSVKVGLFETTYTFGNEAATLEVSYLSPLLPNDLDLFSRPITYVRLTVSSADGKEHDVSICYDVSAEAAVDKADQEVMWGAVPLEGLKAAQFSSVEQPVLKKKGDNLRIDWGRFILAAPEKAVIAIHGDKLLRGDFATKGTLPAEDDAKKPRKANQDWPVIGALLSFGKVTAPSSQTILLAYDDGPGAIEWMGKPLLAWWKRNGKKIEDELKAAAFSEKAIREKCAAYAAALNADLEKAGGKKFAEICALAFRQAWSAHKLAASPTGEPWYFSKENFSNGCIATVDVTYPSAPIMLLLNPALLKGLCTPIFEYAQSDKWPYDYAPHDLGTYPKANGQVYGMGRNDTDGGRMPVEECGNMLVLAAALAHADGNGAYARRYWPLLEKWAAYLEKVGFDPNNQLCTDDFAGHLAHNANLSLKTIVALGGFGKLCEMEGKAAEAAKWKKMAKDMAQQWMKAADNGDHYRLAFDKEGSWSMKYNMVWDRILGLGIFPDEIAKKEMAHYRKVQQRYGLPLDSRKTYTKSDWLVWTATLTGNKEDFEALINPLYDSLYATPSRVPMTDWYETTNAKQSGFQARSVVGGVFIPLLYDAAVWKKWMAMK